MSEISQIYFDKSRIIISRVMSSLVESSDQLRFKAIRPLLKYKIFQGLYTNSAFRLFIGFIIIGAVNLVVAFKRPDLLLVFGPIIYGFFHLIASYHFVQPRENLNTYHEFKKDFTFLFYGTFVFVLLNSIFDETSLLKALPNGFLEIVFISLSYLYLSIRKKTFFSWVLLGVLLINCLILYYAWFNPLVFIGATLFLHNWVAFFYWLLRVKNRANLLTAITATFAFGFVHYMVAYGYWDQFINFNKDNMLLTANIHAVSWILAPLSDDAMVSNRALVLYTFGLAVHYFVWLKAIPENLQTKETPNSFKVTLSKLKKDIGERLILIIFVVMSFGYVLWAVYPQQGSYFYFLIASLHGWIEISFLVPLILSKLKQASHGTLT